MSFVFGASRYELFSALYCQNIFVAVFRWVQKIPISFSNLSMHITDKDFDCLVRRLSSRVLNVHTARCLANKSYTSQATLAPLLIAASCICSQVVQSHPINLPLRQQHDEKYTQVCEKFGPHTHIQEDSLLKCGKKGTHSL